MSQDDVSKPQPLSAEDLVRSALTQGVAGQMAPGIALAVQAIKHARTNGLTVHITVTFGADGSVLFQEPQIEGATQEPETVAA